MLPNCFRIHSRVSFEARASKLAIPCASAESLVVFGLKMNARSSFAFPSPFTSPATTGVKLNPEWTSAITPRVKPRGECFAQRSESVMRNKIRNEALDSVRVRRRRNAGAAGNRDGIRTYPFVSIGIRDVQQGRGEPPGKQSAGLRRESVICHPDATQFTYDSQRGISPRFRLRDTARCWVDVLDGCIDRARGLVRQRETDGRR